MATESHCTTYVHVGKYHDPFLLCNLQAPKESKDGTVAMLMQPSLMFSFFSLPAQLLLDKESNRPAMTSTFTVSHISPSLTFISVEPIGQVLLLLTRLAS